jgi:hypothetical protein
MIYRYIGQTLEQVNLCDVSAVDFDLCPNSRYQKFALRTLYESSYGFKKGLVLMLTSTLFLKPGLGAI